VKPWIRGEEFVWEGTSHLPGFKEEVLAYWAACLTMSRKLVRIFALSLDLAEDYCMNILSSDPGEPSEKYFPFLSIYLKE
jgi:isopenicillin N synthase-like dioxygenase